SGLGLLVVRFLRLLAVRPGFRPQDVLAGRTGLPRPRYSDDARTRNFMAGLLERIRAIPGVENAGITNSLPFSGNGNASIVMIDGYSLALGENPPVPQHNHVDPGYFQTMGIPLLQGRLFSESDVNETQRVAIVDQFMARK